MGRLIVTACLLAGLAICAPSAVAVSDAAARGKGKGQGPRPNVLLIVTDDQPEGGMSVMPDTRALFGDQGTSFENAFVTTPLCCPSRASIFSGQYLHNHGVNENVNGAELFEPRRSWQRLLHRAGYSTALFGKYLNGWSRSQEGLPPHFDRWRPYPPVGETSRSDAIIASYGEGFLRGAERRDLRPWALQLSFHSPHKPLIPPPRYAAADVPLVDVPSMHEADLSDKHPAVARTSRRENALKTQREQLRMLMGTDDQVARVMALLDRLGEDRRTLAIFTSDNGYLWGQHGLTRKFWPYLESVEVPLYVRWPGHVASGDVDERLVANIDIAPTILRAAGLRRKAKWPLDGDSLLRPSDRRWLLLEAGSVRANLPLWASIVNTERQYIRWEDGFREYYRLAPDPFQLESVLGDGDPANAPNVAALDARLDRAVDCAGRACP